MLHYRPFLLTLLTLLAALMTGCHSEQPAPPAASTPPVTAASTPEAQQKSATAQGLRAAARMRGQAMQRAHQKQ